MYFIHPYFIRKYIHMSVLNVTALIINGDVSKRITRIEREEKPPDKQKIPDKL